MVVVYNAFFIFFFFVFILDTLYYVLKCIYKLMLNKRVTHKSVSAYEVLVHNIMEKSGIIYTFCVGVEKLPIQ